MIFPNFKQVLLQRLAIRSNVVHGARLHVGPGSVLWAPRLLSVGNDVYVGKNVTLQFDGTIGDGALFANGCGVVGRHDHDYTQVGTAIRNAAWVGDAPDLSEETHIGSDVWIGFNAVVQSGIRIGNSCLVGAGSVVTKDLPDNSIAAGVPARVLKARFSQEDFERHWELLRNSGTRWMKQASAGQLDA
ncbi:acyltransferase [Rhodococcus cercidiphylli]|uniref:Acyltransferase n=1 Tax=Rhodococcus cercidiphylli TaxID=489916 RepID=A0ABU4B3W0_9NOCA|nr:acyltransferase [Rhodococcus cercidiphylli]MDV6233169.1 acyltransferase [Rhodococcus cercidiphylli]